MSVTFCELDSMLTNLVKSKRKPTILQVTYYVHAIKTDTRNDRHKDQRQTAAELGLNLSRDYESLLLQI